MCYKGVQASTKIRVFIPVILSQILDRHFLGSLGVLVTQHNYVVNPAWRSQVVDTEH